ncbi:unnamed protein product [Dovyalis caffra]|uniref:peptidylprolyl isomerase n=1 Tax=Dovyalis caffra TaxID=77055 RepID=A0AAV1RUI9_9ROSI|nr:unnamed protein product [Dovyalis caffra]
MLGVIGLLSFEAKLSYDELGLYCEDYFKSLCNLLIQFSLTKFENNSASSHAFWLLKESELIPNNANILDGRYAIFSYVIEDEDCLAHLKVGDVIESIQVVSDLDNLVNSSYKIAL